MRLKSSSNLYETSVIKLSLIIPFYNESEGIDHLSRQLRPVIKELRKLYEVDLILIDDGSTDGTFLLLLEKFSNMPHVQFLQHETNRNLGAALQTGFNASSGDVIATMDSDCTYDPGLIIKMIQLLSEEDFDVVTASPYHPAGEISGVGRWHLFLSKSLSFVYSMILPFKLYCYTSMFRVYKKDVINSVTIQSNAFLAVTEILIKAGLKGRHLGELPAKLTSRRHGVSKAKTGMMIVDHLGLIVRILLTRFIPAKLKPLVPGYPAIFLFPPAPFR